jgi:hypothetical protein
MVLWFYCAAGGCQKNVNKKGEQMSNDVYLSKKSTINDQEIMERYSLHTS